MNGITNFFPGFKLPRWLYAFPLSPIKKKIFSPAPAELDVKEIGLHKNATAHRLPTWAQ